MIFAATNHSSLYEEGVYMSNNIEMDEQRVNDIELVDDGRLDKLRKEATSCDPLHGL